jgi:signal transduction histidine kinase
MLNINSAWQILMITWLVNAAAFIILMTITLVVLSKKGKIITLSVAFFSALLINILLDKDVYNSTMAAWSVVTIILFISLFTNKLQSNILSTFIILLLTAGFSAYQINQALHQKTRQLQEFTATMLAQKNDPLMEYQLSSTLKKMKADLKLMELTQSPSLVSTDTIENYINTKYIGSDFNSYNIQITICDSTDFLDIPDQNDFISCYQFFKDLVNNSGNLVQDSLLYNITTSTENIYYLGQINFANNKTIFLEFVSSYVPEGLGYPELIIDQKAQTFNLTNTSYARYFNQTLGYKFGDYKYPILMPPISNNEEKSGYYYSNGYQHYTIHINDNETITVSVPTKTVSEILFPFSILFLLFTISVAIGYLLIYLFSNKNSKTISFRTKLQFFIIGTIIFTTILLALVTMIFMQNNSDLTTQKQLEEKSYSVFIELQHKLGDVIDFSETENMMLENLLKKFSLVFFSDINLYTPEGLLAATSRPEMEQKGLLSNMINPDAYKALIINHQLSFITKEKIGKLSFYSAYLPLFLSENKPAAIINLPFFARQSEIVHTFSALLANFINIAVLIAIIGTILSIVLARLLTKPLLMLQQRMADVDIDKPNQSIFWKNNDEIGQLIAQYNQMVEKLEVSAELLKNSERESTWREMARQIAHEIKNPLTPMKLNVQYLEKAYLEKQPDFPDRLTRTTKLLIEQIETLNNVADMFGEVASSRLKETKVINMKELISGVVELFNNNPDITFVIDFSKPHCLIEAVEKDIIRVMNNLIKNAVQSFTDQANKTIKVSCQCQNNQVTISVKDNGKGISEEIQLNIFKPYFTTKTSGTGLGLAIVKSIVGENKGHITFVSHPGKGSTFKMVFPVVDSLKPISSES